MTGAQVLRCSGARVRTVAVVALGLASQNSSVSGQGFGGFGFAGGGQQEMKLVERFDQDGDKRLDATERKAARESLRGNGGARLARGGGSVVTPGARVTPADVKPVPSSVPVYDPATIRTIFLQFENTDWEQELTAFYNTDVEVPATMIVDGKT